MITEKKIKKPKTKHSLSDTYRVLSVQMLLFLILLPTFPLLLPKLTVGHGTFFIGGSTAPMNGPASGNSPRGQLTAGEITTLSNLFDQG